MTNKRVPSGSGRGTAPWLRPSGNPNIGRTLSIRITGIALGCTELTSTFGSQERNPKRSATPWASFAFRTLVQFGQRAASTTRGRSSPVAIHVGTFLPSMVSCPENDVDGTRQRCSDLACGAPAGACHRLKNSVTDCRWRTWEALWTEYKKLHDLLVQMVGRDELCRRCCAIPGVDPVTALTVKGGHRSPHRFSKSNAVGAHFGLTSRRIETSTSIGVEGHISECDGVVRTFSSRRRTRCWCAPRNGTASRPGVFGSQPNVVTNARWWPLRVSWRWSCIACGSMDLCSGPQKMEVQPNRVLATRRRSPPQC